MNINKIFKKVVGRNISLNYSYEYVYQNKDLLTASAIIYLLDALDSGSKGELQYTDYVVLKDVGILCDTLATLIYSNLDELINGAFLDKRLQKHFKFKGENRYDWTNSFIKNVENLKKSASGSVSLEDAIISAANYHYFISNTAVEDRTKQNYNLMFGNLTNKNSYELGKTVCKNISKNCLDNQFQPQ